MMGDFARQYSIQILGTLTFLGIGAMIKAFRRCKTLELVRGEAFVNGKRLRLRRGGASLRLPGFRSSAYHVVGADGRRMVFIPDEPRSETGTLWDTTGSKQVADYAKLSRLTPDSLRLQAANVKSGNHWNFVFAKS